MFFLDTEQFKEKFEEFKGDIKSLDKLKKISITHLKLVSYLLFVSNDVVRGNRFNIDKIIHVRHGDLLYKKCYEQVLNKWTTFKLEIF